MLEILYSNPMIFVALLIIAIFVVFYFVIKYSGNSKKKVEKLGDKKEEKTGSSEKNGDEQKVAKQTGSSEQSEEIHTDESGSGNDENQEDKEKSKIKKTKQSLKKSKEKPNVEQVYKREKKQETDKQSETLEQPSSITEEDLLQRLQFVKDTKKVSKLAKISEVEQKEIEALEADEQVVADEEKTKEKVSRLSAAKERRAKAFKKGVRLSKFKDGDDYDAMFGSHLSDEYLDIDVTKHLDTSEEVLSKLYQRASDTVVGSDARLLSSDDENYGVPSNRCGGVEAHVEKFKREKFAEYLSNLDKVEEVSEDMKIDELSVDETTKLNPRTLIVADAIMNGRKKRKSK